MRYRALPERDAGKEEEEKKLQRKMRAKQEGAIFMREYRLAEAEARFADLVWANEPIGSTELVKQCEKELGWKKSTTYTVLKKLCVRGIFCNENAIVTAKLSREEFYGGRSRQFVEEEFGGSLPKFLTAFIGKKKLTDAQVEEMKALIESYREE